MDLLDRMTYSESRSINTGDYEKHDVYFSFSTSITKYNQIDQTAEIKHSETTAINHNSTSEEFKAAVEKITKRVRVVLDAREKQIRMATHMFTSSPDNSLAKIGMKAKTKSIFEENEDEFILETKANKK